MSTPPDPVAVARARQLLDNDRAREAEDLARQVLSRSPDSTRALEILARSLTEQGRGPEAAEAARAGLALDPDDLPLGLALCHALIGAKRATQARAVAASLARTHPHVVNAHYTAALAFLGDPDLMPGRALRAAEEARRLAPHDPDTVNLCGVCHAARGDRELARRAFHDALALDPANAFAMANLAGQDIARVRLLRGGSRLTSAMLTSPNSQVLLGQFARQLTRIGFCFFALTMGSLFLVFLLTFQPWWVHAGVATLALALMAGLATPVLRALPRGPRNWAPLVWRHATPFARFSLVVGVLLVVAMLAFGFGPSTTPPPSSVSTGSASSGGGSWFGDEMAPRLVLLLAVLGTRLVWSRRRRAARNDDSEYTPPPGSDVRRPL